jgi:glycosyltransferase involved in cell wall biosynthesis
MPECYVPAFRRYLSDAVTRAVAKAGHILADSESTRHDLMELMAAGEDKVTVIYPGVEPRFCPVLDAQALTRVRARYELPQDFILGLGTLQPRKNFSGLIQAYDRLLRTSGDEPAMQNLHLVIAGGKGWMYEDDLALVQRLGLAQRVRFTGFVDDKDLPALYSLASVFAFPSLYEGFGLPALEAMACGTPVVAADNSSLPEVVGQAAWLVEARDVEALAGALVALLTDELLRARLVDAGFEQARQFTWQDAANRLLSVYESATR